MATQRQTLASWKDAVVPASVPPGAQFDVYLKCTRAGKQKLVAKPLWRASGNVPVVQARSMSTLSQAGGIMRGRLRLLGEGQRRIHRLAPGGCREQRRCRLGLRTKKCLSRLVRRLWGGCLAQSVGLGGASLYHSVEALRGLQTRRWVVAQGHVAS